MACLIIAGEAVFSLPFHVPRFFRPQVLAGLGVTNTELGDAFAIYGLTAMAAYFPGGLLADRFPPRLMLTVALAATALGGAVFASRPSPVMLKLLYAYWGVTTILLLWAAMIKATREWGGPLAQGRAFGWLDAGRGLVAALLSSAVLGLTPGGLRPMVLFYTGTTAAAALLCWWAIPAAASTPAPVSNGSAPRRFRVIGLQSIIVVSAYCGYKGLDYYALLGHQLLGLTPDQAAGWFSASAYLRPIAALAAGWIADRQGAARTVTGLFGLGAVAYALLASGIGANAAWWWYANLVVTIVAVYGLRGVYFALLEESQIEPAQTGRAAGLISLVGYTPDVFFAPIAGRLLDGAPGANGYQLLCGLLAFSAVAGAVAASMLKTTQAGNCRRMSP